MTLDKSIIIYIIHHINFINISKNIKTNERLVIGDNCAVRSEISKPGKIYHKGTEYESLPLKVSVHHRYGVAQRNQFMKVLYKEKM